MIRITIFFPLLLANLLVNAQTTFIISSLPDNHPEAAPIYIAGDFNSWDPGNSEFELMLESGVYFLTLNQTGTIHFKFTRGTWDFVEVNANGSDIANRSQTLSNEGDTIYLEIEGWKDLAGNSSNSTKAENVSIISGFDMPQLNRTRRLWVYLPPDYDFSNDHYPVIYMHDGQNLFDNATSFSGEWGVDETLNKLYQEHGLAMIVVGIDNGGSKRISEYSPWENDEYGGGEGDLYTDFLVNTLKPYIDSNYRTLRGPSETYLIGSSLGGLISHYAGLKQRSVYGKIGALSPAFWFNPEIFDFTDTVGINMVKVYLCAGGSESASVTANMTKMKDHLIARGVTEVHTEVHPNQGHNEAYWRKIFPEVLAYLLDSPYLLQNNEEIQLQWEITNNTFSIVGKPNTIYNANIYDLAGQLLIQDTVSNEKIVSLGSHANKPLLIHLTSDRYQQVIRVRSVK